MSKTYIKVNDVALPHPTSFDVKSNDLDSENSTRSEGSGVLTRERIRHGIHEIEYGVDMITDSALEMLQNVFEPEKIIVDFWWGKAERAEMYASTPHASIMQYDPSTDVTYWSFSVSLTEY